MTDCQPRFNRARLFIRLAEPSNLGAHKTLIARNKIARAIRASRSVNLAVAIFSAHRRGFLTPDGVSRTTCMALHESAKHNNLGQARNLARDDQCYGLT